MPSRRRFLLAAAATATSAAAAATRLEALSQAEARQPTPTFPPAVAALPNRRSLATPISFAERGHRLDRARELMHNHSMDAIAITTGSSLTYFTGLRWGQSERLFAWVLPAHGTPFLICPAFEEPRVRERMSSNPPTLAPETRVLTWQEDQDPYALVATGLRDAGLTTARIGIDEKTQFVFADGIAHASPTLTITSATPITAGCRSIKSPAELALMQLANATTLAVYEAAFKSLQPGMTNHQVEALIATAYLQSGFPGEASCEVGPNSAVPHGTLQPQTLRESEMILLDDGCQVEGYQSDISRSFVLGRATQEQNRVFEVVHRAQTAALAAARPGVQCQAIDQAARAVIIDAGFGPAFRTFTHRVGHGIGLDGHEWPYLVGGNTTPLAPGMCFSDEPGIYLPGKFGIRLEDDWHVTESGGQFFTQQSPSLEHPFAT